MNVGSFFQEWKGLSSFVDIKNSGMVLILILIILALFAVIVSMRLRLKKMHDEHLQRLEDLHMIILELSQNQKINQEKIQLAEEFKGKFNHSKLILSDKILALQHDFLDMLSKNNLIR